MSEINLDDDDDNDDDDDDNRGRDTRETTSMAVEPTCWPAADSCSKVTAACKSVTRQISAQQTCPLASSQKPKMTGDDD